jgi:hypothetical protein
LTAEAGAVTEICAAAGPAARHTANTARNAVLELIVIAIR